MKNVDWNVKTADGTNTKKVPLCQGERNAGFSGGRGRAGKRKKKSREQKNLRPDL